MRFIRGASDGYARLLSLPGGGDFSSPHARRSKPTSRWLVADAFTTTPTVRARSRPLLATVVGICPLIIRTPTHTVNQRAVTPVNLNIGPPYGSTPSTPQGQKLASLVRASTGEYSDDWRRRPTEKQDSLDVAYHRNFY